MDNNIFHIAYSIDNQNIAQEIDNHFSRVGIELDHIMVDHVDSSAPLQERLQNASHFVLLLVSDNFLKNINCMDRGLFMIQELYQKEKVQPIIIDGRSRVDGTDTYQNVPTEFTRMTHIIRYMNYWQDYYLDQRKVRRSVPDEQVEAFDERLKIVRGVSSETGEFLKYLKNNSYWSYQEFSHNGFELFFQAINQPNLSETLKQAISNGEIPKTAHIPIPVVVAPPIIEQPKVETPIIETPVVETPIVETPVIETPTFVEPTPIIETPTVTTNTEITTPQPSVNELLQKEEPIVVEPIIKETIIEQPIVETPSIEFETPQEEIPDVIDLVNSDPVEEPTIETTPPIEVSHASTVISQIISKSDDEILKISEEKLKKKGKVPLLDKLIKHRNEDLRLQNQTIENKIVDTPPIESTPIIQKVKQEGIVEKKVIKVIKNKQEKDQVFEETINQIIDEEQNPTPQEESKFRLNPTLTHIFHDTDKELDSDQMIGTFELSSNRKKSFWKDQLEKANRLIRNGKLYAGLNLIRETVEENQDNVTLRYEYAVNLMDGAESYKAARREFEKVLKLNPKNIDAYARLATLATYKKDTLLAKSYYEKALELDKNNPDLQYRLGLLIATKFPDLQDQAAEYFKQSLKTDDTNPDAHYRYGLILDEHFKKPKKAMRHFEITAELQPDHLFVNYDLALIHYRFGSFKKAAEYYNIACTINPELKSVINDQAFLAPQENEEILDISTDLDDIFKDLDNDANQTIELQKIVDSPSIETPIPAKATQPRKNENFEKVVLITGATSGIGKATASLFAQNGFRVILTGRRAERLAALKEEFENKFPTEIETLVFDVRKIDDAQAAIASLSENWNSIDILINNAGLAKGFDPIHEGKLEDWNTMIDTNVKGLLYMTRFISPSMVARRKGHIINVCSTAGHEAYPKGNVYCATKHAVDALTKGMRLDLYKHGLRVSQVSPAHVEETEFAKVRFDGDEERAKIYEDFKPLSSADVANTIYFIATQPDHVNIQDVMLMGKQQANSQNVDRSGRK